MSKYNEIIAVDDMAQGTFEEREKKNPISSFFLERETYLKFHLPK